LTSGVQTNQAAPSTALKAPAYADATAPGAPQVVLANPFVDTATDASSTFGLDVDTGSYTVGRQSVSQGQRPAPASVRVEEYVNYFAQDYPAPVTGDFGITVDGASTPFLTDPSHRLVRVGVRAREVTAMGRKPVALTFLVDTSGSMGQSNRLPLVKDSLAVLVDQLDAGDSVAIVEFGSDARVVLAPTSAADKATIKAGVSSLHTEGSTNAEAGLLMAYKLADDAFKAGAVNRVVLASDGGANVGVVDGTTLTNEISAHAAKGIQLTTIGFGMGDYNDTLMEQLADKGDGFYAYVDDIGEAKRLFSERLTSALETVALDAKAQVTFDPANVTRYRLLGYENRDVPDILFRDDPRIAGPKAKGAQINAGHRMTALYEIELSPSAQAVPGARVGTVTAHWTVPEARTPAEMTHPITTASFASDWTSASSWFRLDAVVAQYAETLRGSPWIKGSLADVANVAHALPADLAKDADVRELIGIIDQASRAPGASPVATGER
jgi:Ca-activated chloride channel family protein